MALIVRFSDTDDDVIEFNPSADTSQYQGLPHTVINPDLSTVQNLARKYWKLVTGVIQPMTAQEQIDKDAAIAAALTAAARASGKARDESDIVIRALIAILTDEINILRQWTVSFKAETGLSANITDFQNRVATLPTLNDRTVAQARTAFDNKFDSGAVDS